MSKNKLEQVQEIKKSLNDFSEKIFKLVGLDSETKIEVLSKQINDSIRRVKYVKDLTNAKFVHERMEPSSELFDPLKAAVLMTRQGNIDEACWLVFLAVHFGKHSKNKWRLVRKIYGKLGSSDHWCWNSIKGDLKAFSNWFNDNIHHFDNERFSNHRKYESLKDTVKVLASYVNWVQSCGGHDNMIRDIHRQVGQNPREVFDQLYKNMNKVTRFGRLAKFDYLTMLGKLGIFPIEPGSAYLKDNATGPIRGARLLFGGDVNAQISPKNLEERLKKIDDHLHVGMQVLEDSLCNWQKSPEVYTLFRG